MMREGYENDYRQNTEIPDMFTTEKLAEIKGNANYSSPSDNL